MKKLKKAYEKLALQEYKSIIDEANGVIFRMNVFDDADELIITLHQHSEFTLVKHFHMGKMYGYNVYTRVEQTLRLVDTRSTKKAAHKLISRLHRALGRKQLEYILQS